MHSLRRAFPRLYSASMHRFAREIQPWARLERGRALEQHLVAHLESILQMRGELHGMAQGLRTLTPRSWRMPESLPSSSGLVCILSPSEERETRLALLDMAASRHGRQREVPHVAGRSHGAKQVPQGEAMGGACRQAVRGTNSCGLVDVPSPSRLWPASTSRAFEAPRDAPEGLRRLAMAAPWRIPRGDGAWKASADAAMATRAATRVNVILVTGGVKIEMIQLC